MRIVSGTYSSSVHQLNIFQLLRIYSNSAVSCVQPQRITQYTKKNGATENTTTDEKKPLKKQRETSRKPSLRKKKTSREEKERKLGRRKNPMRKTTEKRKEYRNKTKDKNKQRNQQKTTRARMQTYIPCTWCVE